MEKKYRIKEEVKKQYDIVFIDEYLQSEGNIQHFRWFGLDELEEVETRVKLHIHGGYKHFLVKEGAVVTYQEKDLCEKALNGDLITKEQAIGFATWFSEDSVAIEANLEMYLKQKK